MIKFNSPKIEISEARTSLTVPTNTAHLTDHHLPQHTTHTYDCLIACQINSLIVCQIVCLLDHIIY
jgi:hypothetical protein